MKFTNLFLSSLLLLPASCITPTFGVSHETHVALSAPSKDASFDERLQAYQELQPSKDPKRIRLKIRQRRTTDSTPEARTDYLKLQNGMQVYQVSDLLSVVPSDSETAKAIEEHQKIRKKIKPRKKLKNILIATGGVIAAVGITGAVTANISNAENIDDRLRISYGLVIGGMGTAVLSMIPGSQVKKWDRESVEPRENAMLNYEKSLRESLDLCMVDTEIVDCATTRALTIPASALQNPDEPTNAEETIVKEENSTLGEETSNILGEAAQQLYEEGVKFYEAQNYQDALLKFEEAYHLSQEKELLYNIAQCHQSLGRYQEALEAYKAFLPEVKNPAVQKRVKTLITELEAEINALNSQPTTPSSQPTP